MHAIDKSCGDLIEYAKLPIVSSATKEKYKKGFCYHYGTQRYAGGLTNYLKERFYARIKTSHRRFKKGQSYQKKASSKTLGKRIDREIFNLVSKKRSKRPQHPFTRALIRFWDAKGLKPVASQLFVPLPDIGKATQADVIVQDQQGKLWMHEIKTGYVAVNTSKGTFSAPFDNVKCTKANQWDLQRYFTDYGLREAGLKNYAGSHVIHVYEDKTKEEPVVIQKTCVFKPRLA